MNTIKEQVTTNVVVRGDYRELTGRGDGGWDWSDMGWDWSKQNAKTFA